LCITLGDKLIVAREARQKNNCHALFHLSTTKSWIVIGILTKQYLDTCAAVGFRIARDYVMIDYTRDTTRTKCIAYIQNF